MDNNELERREYRRKRRIRNQILVYLTMILVVAIVSLGIIFVVKNNTEREQAESLVQSSQQEVIEEMVSSESEIEKPTPTPVPTPSPDELLNEFIDEIVEQMPIEDRVAGLFFVTPESITGVGTAVKAGDGTKEALSKYAVGGIIYFEKNIKDAAQFEEMISNTKLYSKYPLFIGLDEEGGDVTRLAEAGLMEKQAGAGAIAQSGDTNAAYNVGVTIGSTMASYGANVDFAPVADIANVENSVMLGRTYENEATIAIPYVLEMMRGLEEQGVSSCLKHFPGIGATTEDTHEGLATVNRTAEEFRANEFTVFKAGIDAGADFVMIGHVDAPQLTGDNTPASMSKVIVTDILRNELGFDGVIITDAMNMKAISEYYDSGEAAVQALKAGCDMILMPEDFEDAYVGVLQALADGVIAEERINDSIKRIYRVKYAGKFEE
ncbi:MAG: beta-N-acetylhexosaminidase [Lachnospiraceae bacterium]|nr:beta-N-acetylhexosaminidase [Lachnospiraceae bacterium]